MKSENRRTNLPIILQEMCRFRKNLLKVSCVLGFSFTIIATLFFVYYDRQRGDHPHCREWYCYIPDKDGYPVMGECGGVVGQTSECPVRWMRRSSLAQQQIEQLHRESDHFAQLINMLPIRSQVTSRACVQRVLPPAMSQRNTTLRYTGEFGYDMMVVLPFAHYLHLQGDGYLKKVIGCGDMSDLYTPWTNKYETDATCTRDYDGALLEYGFPDVGLNTCPPPCFWSPPPLAKIYRSRMATSFNDPTFKVGQKLVVINNKFNVEWGSAPVNFIDLNALQSMIDFADQHGVTIIYNRPRGERSFRDSAHSALLNPDLLDEQLIQDGLHKGRWSPNAVRDFSAIRPRGVTMNRAQLELYARARCFVSVQGGNSYLPFYFGGRHVIYHVKGTEDVCAYKHNFPQLGGARIQSVSSYQNLIVAFEKMITMDQCHSIEPGRTVN